MYHKLKESERIRYDNEMRRLREKLSNECFKAETVKQMKNLTIDDRNMMEYVYPVNVPATNEALLHVEQQTNVDNTQQQNDFGRRVEGTSKNVTGNEDNENSIHLGAWPEKSKETINDSKHAETQNDENAMAEEGKKRDGIGKDE